MLELSHSYSLITQSHEKESGNIVYNELLQWNVIIAYVTVFTPSLSFELES